MTLVAICLVILQRPWLFFGSLDVIGHATFRLPEVDFLWVVHMSI